LAQDWRNRLTRFALTIAGFMIKQAHFEIARLFLTGLRGAEQTFKEILFPIPCR
jgi:hypothetical protein